MPVTRLVSYSVERVEVLDLEGDVDDALMPPLTAEQIHHLYEVMVLTRQLDDRMLKLQRQGRLGTFARVLGQEGAHIPAAMALRDKDWLVPSFREIGTFLVRGVPIAGLLQHASGDERGGALPEGSRTLPVAIPVGTHMIHAVGIGWVVKHEDEKAAVLTIFGEGATSEGDFSEAMNFAAVFQAPVVFFCQNNQWAISVPYYKQTAACTVAQKSIGFGMPGVQVDGNDPFAVYKVVSEALQRARDGGGPSLVEAWTYRMTDHTTSDDARRYRTAAEVEPWLARDPIRRLGLYMKKKGLLDDDTEQAILQDADRQVSEAVAVLDSLDLPSPDEIFAHVYAQPTAPLVEQREALRGRLKERG